MTDHLALKAISFLGPDVDPAHILSEYGLNVICGASDTGKSFLVEAVDYLLGGKELRDIPELAGYDRARVSIESSKFGTWTFERSIAGGNYRIVEGLLDETLEIEEYEKLKLKHAAGRDDNISGWLLNAIGLLDKSLRKNALGVCRSLSFRDLARLIIVNEEEIIRQDSPYLTGQYTTATAEKSCLKLMLTGIDDSAIVPAESSKESESRDLAKIELLEQWITDTEEDIDEFGNTKEELEDQLRRLRRSIADSKAQLSTAQFQLREVTGERREIVQRREAIKDRLDDIENILERFALLKAQYVTDLQRLTAIEESGSLFVHQAKVDCPLCGASPEHQHTIETCEGDIESVVHAAVAEMEKIQKLASDLDSTVISLRDESQRLGVQLEEVENEFSRVDERIRGAITPNVSDQQSSYSELIDARSGVKQKLSMFERLDKLQLQKSEILGEGSQEGASEAKIKLGLPTRTLHDFSKTVESILKAWDFPDAGSVHFDESAMDFVINGNLRGNRGKGLRAITHAAATLGLLEFCKSRSLPHPGFVVLDSPLLAYYKPEGDDDNLQGSALKQKFYKYLIEEHSDSQIIVLENEHPPDAFEDQLELTVFTKNPHEGRFGLFPLK